MSTAHQGETEQGADAPQVKPVKVVFSVKLTALAYPEPDGGYSVRVPALPGCFTEGDDMDQVREMVAEAAEGWLAVKHDMEMERNP
jgi:predicted RNase H-like HicB family nuclease